MDIRPARNRQQHIVGVLAAVEHGIVELSRKFPHANIRVKYADEDIGSNCGWYALCKGDFVDDGYPSKGNAAIDFACNIWGYDANAYRAEMSLL